jgi:hypothetical protein
MKKISTRVGKQCRKISEQKLAIGLDLGDRWSWYCVLDEVGEVVQEQKLGTTPKAMKGSIRDRAAQPDRIGNRDALAVGEPVVERVRTRSDRGACAQCAVDR